MNMTALIICIIIAVVLTGIGLFVMLYLKGSNTGVGFLAVCVGAAFIIALAATAAFTDTNYYTVTCPECEVEVNTPFCSICGWENTNMSFCAECGDNTAPLYCGNCATSDNE